MPKFMVYESATTVCVYEIEAESKDKAQEIVDEGYSEPVRTEYIEREVYDIVEVWLPHCYDCGYEWSSCMGDDELPDTCECGGKVIKEVSNA